MKKITLGIEKVTSSFLKYSKFLRKESVKIDTNGSAIPFVELPTEFNKFQCENIQVFDFGKIIINNDNKKLLVAVILADF